MKSFDQNGLSQPILSSFEENPETPADTAPIFWEPSIDPTVLRTVATRANSCTIVALDLFDLAVNAAVLALPDREELMLGQGNRTIRLSVIEGSILSGPATLEFRLRSTDPLTALSSSIRRFSVFSRTGEISATRLGSAAKRVALLRTLDALAKDSRQRQVAIALFGERHVDASWNATSDYLRSRVRRQIRRAHALAAGTDLPEPELRF